MPGAVNASLYHNQIRNLFSAGTAAATNSPLAFLERTSSYTQQLLKEQSAANDNIARQLSQHTKLLEKLAKSTGTGLGLSDLVLSRYIARFLSGAALAVSGAATAVFGGTKTLAGRALTALRVGTKTMFGRIGGLIFTQVRSFLEEGLAIITRVGRPIVSMFTKLTALATTGGLLTQAAAIGSRIAKGGALLMRGIGKLAWPITALLGVLDGVRGYMAADKDLGRGGKVNIFRKIEYAKASIVNGLLLGLPDYISKRLTGKGYGQLVDAGIMAMSEGFNKYSKSFVNKFRAKMSTARERLREMWSNLPTREELATFSTNVRDVIMGLGSYIQSGMTTMVENIRSWFQELFNTRMVPPQYAPWLDDAMKPGPRRAPGGNPWMMTPTSPLAPAGSPSRSRSPIVNRVTSSIDQMKAQAPARSTGGIGQIRTVPKVQARAPAEQQPNTQQLLRMNLPNPVQVYKDLPNVVKETIELGASFMMSLGTTLAKSTAETSAQIADKTGEIAGQGIAEGVTSVFEKELSVTGILGDLLKNTARAMKDQFNRIFTKQNLSTLTDILTGNRESANLGAMLGAPTTLGTGGIGPDGIIPSAPGWGLDANGNPGVVQQRTGNTGVFNPSSPAPNRPAWWDQTRIGPQRPLGNRGALPPEAYATQLAGGSPLPNSAASTMYGSILAAETGSAGSGTDPRRFIRTRVTPAQNRGRSSSAYGPSQMTMTYLKDFKEKQWNNLNPQEQQYLDGLIAQGKTMLSVGRSNPSDPIYGYGGKGTMGDTPEQRALYQSIAQKSMTSLAKESSSYQSFIGGYRGEHDGPYFRKIARELAKQGLTPEQVFAEMQGMDVANAGSVGPASSTSSLAASSAPLIAKFAAMKNLDPYGGIPEKDIFGMGQRDKFRQWNSNPFVNNDKMLSTVDPSLQAVVRLAQRNSNFVVGSGARSAEDQAMARRFGWSKSDHSDHEDKKAVDLWSFDPKTGQINFQPKNQADIVTAMKAAATSVGLDLDVGADWKNPDKPHFALKGNKRLSEALINQILNPGADSLNGPRRATPVATRFGKGGSLSQEAAQSAVVMQAKMAEHGFGADRLLGTTNVASTSNRVEPKSQMKAVEKAVTRVSTPNPVLNPTVTAPTPLAPAKGENVQMKATSIPSIKQVPVVDELRMLATNSDLIQ